MAASLAAPHPSFASGCTSSTKAGTVKLGSKVAGDTVTICASRDWLKKILKKPLPATAKPRVIVKPKPVVKPISKPVQLTKKRPVSKPVVKKRRNSNAAVFRAMRPVASRLPLGVLRVQQSVSFSTKLKTKVSLTNLLGQPVQVRFTPKRTSWDLGDGATAEGINPTHAYAARGIYSVRLRVLYAVDYRAIGGQWIREATPIWLAAPALSVPVGVLATQSQLGGIVLVRAP